MIKIDDKIVLYLSGNLGAEEQAKLESEIENSAELKEQLFYYKERLKGLKDIPENSLNEYYFQNLLPRVKTRIKPERKKSFAFKLAFSFPIILVIALVFYFVNSDSNNFEKIITELPETYASSIIDELSDENEDLYTQLNLDTTTVEIINASLLTTDDLGDKINSANIVFSTDELNENLSDEELNEIYSEMLKTKLL